MIQPNTEAEWIHQVTAAQATLFIHSANRGNAEPCHIAPGSVAKAKRILRRGRAAGYYPDPIDVCEAVRSTLSQAGAP